VADEKPKAAPLPWLLLTGLLGSFAVGNPTTAPSPVPGPKKADDKKPADEPPARIAFDDPLKPGLRLPQDATTTALKAEDQLRDQIHGYKTGFLIATVPDPIDSAYGHAFDQVVDAIQRAVEKKDGYVLDRCWLPWDLDRKAKPKDGERPPNLRETKPASSCSGQQGQAKTSRNRACSSFSWSARRRWAGSTKQAFYRASA